VPAVALLPVIRPFSFPPVALVLPGLIGVFLEFVFFSFSFSIPPFLSPASVSSYTRGMTFVTREME